MAFLSSLRAAVSHRSEDAVASDAPAAPLETALFAHIRESIPFTISDLAQPAREILGGASYPQSKERGALRYIYYKHLDKRITALEEAWAWATPRTFGWVDSKGNIEIVSENRAARRLRERAERLDPQLKLDFDPQPASSEATPAPAVQPWLPGLDPVTCAEAAEFTAEFAASANARVCPPIFEPPGQKRPNPDIAAGSDSGASHRKSTAYARSARAQSGPDPAFFRNPDIRGHLRTAGECGARIELDSKTKRGEWTSPLAHGRAEQLAFREDLRTDESARGAATSAVKRFVLEPPLAVYRPSPRRESYEIARVSPAATASATRATPVGRTLGACLSIASASRR